jgi:hypothetical protein
MLAQHYALQTYVGRQTRDFGSQQNQGPPNESFKTNVPDDFDHDPLFVSNVNYKGEL